MKNLILCLFLITLSYSAMGQNFVHWYDNYDEDNYITGYYPLQLGTYDLFPDSTVKTAYTDQFGNTVLGYVSTQGLGEVFDPKSMMYQTSVKSINPYTVDSVSMAYTYNYVSEKGAAPDTLIFQFYTGAGIDTGIIAENPSENFPQENVAWTGYNYLQNLGTGAIREVKVLLGAGYATGTSGAAIHVATNGAAGIRVKPGGLFAYTVSYRPGFKYKTGDTISEAFSPKNLHSRFSVYAAFSTQKIAVTDYEEGLSIVSANRYNQFPGWNGRYVSGTAWTDYTVYVYSQFHTIVGNIASDAGLSEIVSPDGSNAYCANDHLIVSVSINNFQGTAELNSAVISWTVNGIAQTDYNWTGSLFHGNSETITIGSIPFSQGYNTIKAWVSKPNGGADSLNFNDTSTTSFYVTALPNAHFTESPISAGLISFTASDMTLASYNWDFGDGQTATSQSPSHQYTHDGTYKVSLSGTNNNGCQAVFDTSISISNAAIENYAHGDFGFNIYPNPFSGVVTISYGMVNAAHVQVELYDVLGRSVCTFINENHDAGKYQEDINTDAYHLSPGIYTLKFTVGSSSVSERMVKL